MAYVGSNIIARQQSVLGPSGVELVLQLSHQVYHKGEPLDAAQLRSLQDLVANGIAAIKRKYGHPNGCNGSRAAFKAIGQALSM